MQVNNSEVDLPLHVECTFMTHVAQGISNFEFRLGNTRTEAEAAGGIQTVKLWASCRRVDFRPDQRPVGRTCSDESRSTQRPPMSLSAGAASLKPAGWV
jgi:hypothetical protein